MNNHDTITQFPKSAIERLPFPISREDLARAIEVLIALTDILEPDPDLEPDLESEPGTWTETQSNQRLAVQGEDFEETGDMEPNLGAPETRCPPPSIRMTGDPEIWLGGTASGNLSRDYRTGQVGWAKGGDKDLEDDTSDDEPSLLTAGDFELDDSGVEQ